MYIMLELQPPLFFNFNLFPYTHYSVPTRICYGLVFIYSFAIYTLSHCVFSSRIVHMFSTERRFQHFSEKLYKVSLVGYLFSV